MWVVSPSTVPDPACNRRRFSRQRSVPLAARRAVFRRLCASLCDREGELADAAHPELRPELGVDVLSALKQCELRDGREESG
jgi:hypothetical protein